MFLISYGYTSKNEIAHRTDVCLNLQGIIKFFVNLLEHLRFSLAIQIFLLDLSSY